MTQTTYFLAALFLVGLFVVMVSSYPTDRASEPGEEAGATASAENTLAETEIQEPAPAATMQGESEHCGYITAASLQDYEWGREFCRTPLAELGDVLSLHVTGSGSMRPTFEIEIGEDLANGMVHNAFYSDRRRGEAPSEQLVASWWERATHLTKFLNYTHPRIEVKSDWDTGAEKFAAGGNLPGKQVVYYAPLGNTWGDQRKAERRKN